MWRQGVVPRRRRTHSVPQPNLAEYGYGFSRPDTYLDLAAAMFPRAVKYGTALSALGAVAPYAYGAAKDWVSGLMAPSIQKYNPKYGPSTQYKAFSRSIAPPGYLSMNTDSEEIFQTGLTLTQTQTNTEVHKEIQLPRALYPDGSVLMCELVQLDIQYNQLEGDDLIDETQAQKQMNSILYYNTPDVPTNISHDSVLMWDTLDILHRTASGIGTSEGFGLTSFNLNRQRKLGTDSRGIITGANPIIAFNTANMDETYSASYKIWFKQRITSAPILRTKKNMFQ